MINANTLIPHGTYHGLNYIVHKFLFSPTYKLFISDIVNYNLTVMYK